MSDTFPYATDPDTAPLWRALQSGSTLVRTADREVRYQSSDQLMAAMKEIARLKSQQGAPARPRAGFAGHSRGHC